MKKNGKRQNFELKAFANENWILVLDPIYVEHRSLWINCISWVLTVLSIFLTILVKLICHWYFSRIIHFQSMSRFCISFQWFFFSFVMYLWDLWQLKCMNDLLFMTMKEDKATLVFYINNRNDFFQRDLWPVLQVKCYSKLSLVVIRLQKTTCNLAKNFYQHIKTSYYISDLISGRLRKSRVWLINNSLVILSHLFGSVYLLSLSDFSAL